MKKLVLIVLMSAIVSGASAQFRGRGDGGFHRGRTTVVVRGGIYPHYYYPYGGLGWYSSWYNAPYYRNYNRPSKLDMEVADIKHDYSDRIHSVKMDNTLPAADRKAKVRELKQERKDAVYQAKRDYYKS